MATLLAPPAAPPAVRARTHSTPGRLEMDLVVTPKIVPIARTIVVAQVKLWGLGGLADTMALVLSELLTNVLNHTRPTPGTQTQDATITVTRIPDGLFLCVRDTDPTPPHILLAGVEDEHGRGLHLVQTMVHEFGVSAAAVGKDVWATFLTSGGA